MSSSKPAGRIWRGQDAPRVTAARFAVDLPGAARSHSSPADRIESARAEGYEEGYAAAVAELTASAEGERRQRLGEVADALMAAARAMVDGRRTAVAVAEVEVVDLAVDLAEAVVRRDLAMGRSVATDALRRALTLVPSGEDVVVRLHPGDAVSPEELQALVPEAQVRVLADPEVEPGGCVVDAGPCHVDAQIGPALARARALLDQLRPLDKRAPVDQPTESGAMSPPPGADDPAPMVDAPVVDVAVVDAAVVDAAVVDAAVVDAAVVDAAVVDAAVVDAAVVDAEVLP